MSRGSSRRPEAALYCTLLILAVSVAVVALLAGCVTDTTDSTARAHVAAVPPADVPQLPDSPGRPPRYPRLTDDPVELPTVNAVARPALTPPTDPQIEALLDSLTLRQRIGQRFIARVRGDRVARGAGSAIVDVSPAGFILYPWNFSNVDEARRLAESLQWVASVVTPDISLLLCADQEGGRVATFRFPEFVRVPSASVLGRFADPTLIRSAAYLTSRQLSDIGINMNLAPVLDLYEHADASIIGDRSFGGDPTSVASLVRPYLEASREAGVIATAKHFPGHGVTTVDSHLDLPLVQTSRSELESGGLVPFVEAIAAGVPVIMTGHLLFEQIDPYYPVTLSRVFLHDLLRLELGYQGVVITDGLEMAAIRDHFSLEETLVRLFKYDVDLILLYQEYDVVDLVLMVEELLAEGRITRDDVDRGVRRVLRLKRDYGLINGDAP